jgi:hypothetical protein
MMKGFSQPLTSHPVLAMGPPYDLSLPGESGARELTPLQIPLTAWLVEGKKVSQESLHGQSTALGEGLLEVSLPVRIEKSGNLKLNLELCAEAHCFEDIYAKVMEVSTGGRGHIHLLRVTAISAQDRQMLDRWRKQAS